MSSTTFRPIRTTSWAHLGPVLRAGKNFIVDMTGSHFRLRPARSHDDKRYRYLHLLASSSTATDLKQLDIGYFFYSGPYVDDIRSRRETIIHIPNVNSAREHEDKMREGGAHHRGA